MTRNEDRDAIRERLAELEAANGGRLTPEAVIADAKKPNSPLHSCFEWDVKKAAYAHWLDQARTLITSVRVEMKTDTVSVKAVYYVRDPTAGDGVQGYVSVVKLRTDKDLARSALVSEFNRVADMLRRARELAAVLDAAEDVEALLTNVVGLRQRFIEEAPSRAQ